MEKFIDNKKRFFGLYFGQPIAVLPGLTSKTLADAEKSDIPGIHLELIPLSHITDEDALEIAKLNPYADYRKGNDPQPYIEHTKGFIHNPDFQLAIYADYLRSKCYALPYMGISVEQQIEWGWVKLKDMINERN